MRGCAGGGWRSRNSEAEQEGERERARSIASASASQLFLFLAFSRPPFFSSLLHFSKTSQWLSPSVPLACPRYVACGRRGGDGRAPQGAAAGGGGDENSRECNFALSFFLSEEIKKKNRESHGENFPWRSPPSSRGLPSASASTELSRRIETAACQCTARRGRLGFESERRNRKRAKTWGVGVATF